MSFTRLDEGQLAAAGMDSQRVSVHQNRVVKALKKEVETTIPVVQACTVENGGVLGWSRILGFLGHVANAIGEDTSEAMFRYWQTQKLVTCIPAAGAASRFLKELFALCADF